MPTFRSDDGLEIAYDCWGKAAGVPVLLHHGFAASAHIDWVQTGVVDALTAAGRHVVALDARGHGRSDKPHDPSRLGEARMAQDVVSLIDEIGVPRVDLVGYSMELSSRCLRPPASRGYGAWWWAASAQPLYSWAG